MQQSQFGIFLALIGALILTPDSLFMRLSQMDGGAMLAWRATLAGMVFLLIGLNKRRRSIDTSKRIFSKSFVALIICQIANTSFFAFAISLAPVAIVFGGCGHRSDHFRDPERAVFGGTRQPPILGHHLDR
jgi:hypothetical protein